MKFRLSRFPGQVIVLLVLFAPGAVVAYILRNPAWLIAVPIGIFVLLFALALPMSSLDVVFGIGRRKDTPEEFADALEKLLGEKSDYAWDDLVHERLADPRLEQIRLRVTSYYYSSTREQDEARLRPIIVALRRGELPEVPPARRIGSLFRFRG